MNHDINRDELLCEENDRLIIKRPLTDNEARLVIELAYKKHLRFLTNLALKITSGARDAEDIVNDAFIKVWKRLQDGKDLTYPMNLSSYLKTAVFKTAINYMRKLNRSPLLISEDDNLDMPEFDNGVVSSFSQNPPSPEDIIYREQLANIITERLTPNFSQPLLLREFGDYEYGEIAEKLKMPIGTVMSRLYRARIKVRELLNSALHTHDKNTDAVQQAV